MQTRALVVGMTAAALLLAGCAGGGLFRGHDDRAEAARLLIKREAEKERALQQSEEEAAAAQRALDEREQQALQEQDEDAARRKREEAEDLQQERRHRRERKEAEHDAELRELYRGSQTPAKLPPELENYLNAIDRFAAALTEAARIDLECSWLDTLRERIECIDRLRENWATAKSNEAHADAVAAFHMIPHGVMRALTLQALETEEFAAFGETAAAASKTQDEAVAQSEIYNDAAAAYRAAPAHSDADERAVADAAWRKLRALNRAHAKAQAAHAANLRAYATRARLIITPETLREIETLSESLSAAITPEMLREIETLSESQTITPETLREIEALSEALLSEALSESQTAATSPAQNEADDARPAATTAAAPTAPPAKPQQHANCYDGSKLLIQPHETMRQWEARCTPQSEAEAWQAEAIEAAKRLHTEQQR